MRPTGHQVAPPDAPNQTAHAVSTPPLPFLLQHPRASRSSASYIHTYPSGKTKRVPADKQQKQHTHLDVSRTILCHTAAAAAAAGQSEKIKNMTSVLLWSLDVDDNHRDDNGDHHQHGDRGEAHHPPIARENACGRIDREMSYCEEAQHMWRNSRQKQRQKQERHVNKRSEIDTRE